MRRLQPLRRSLSVTNCITMVPQVKGKDPRTGEKYGKPYANWTTHPNNPGALKAAE